MCGKRRASWRGFLKDVFVCSLGAYGGPEAHIGVFTEQMVVRGRYLGETDLIELIALCSMLLALGQDGLEELKVVGMMLGQVAAQFRPLTRLQHLTCWD